MLARSFLIESSSKLLVTRAGIKARTSLISGRIRLLTFELLALEWQKFYTFELEYLWGKLANLDQILFVASLGVGKGCIMFWGRLDQNSGAHRLIMGKCCLHASSFIFDRIIVKVAGNQDRHKSLVKFDFGLNQTYRFGVTCPWVTKISHFWTWIPLKPVNLSWSNFMCSIIGVGGKAA